MDGPVKFTPLPLAGAYQIELDKREDERGFFARSFCAQEYIKRGLEHHFVQMNHSSSRHRGTLRGLHYQLAPMAEVKVVRCIRGCIWDCILDLRAGSSTFLQWLGIELSATNYTMLYVPQGFAHGFVSLEEDSEILYQVSQYYSNTLERGVRWNDPRFGIQWPIEPKVISDRDQAHADFQLAL